ncbi:MAG: hypothetical protein M3014_05960 [Chloroflexota bacterium]|nr:hypothetical protein [Chloroflexota bacterium]
MQRNTDWKLPAALILAGLALFVAIGGRSMSPFMGGDRNPAIVINANGDQGGSANAAPAPTVVAPSSPAPMPGRFGYERGFGRGGFGSPFGFILPLLFIFLAFRFLVGRRHWHRRGPDGYWQGPGSGWQGGPQQGPSGQQPPQQQAWQGGPQPSGYPQQQGWQGGPQSAQAQQQQPQQQQAPHQGQATQPHQAWPGEQAQQQQPAQPRGRWVWQEDVPPTPPAPPSYGGGYHGDIERPGQGDQS